MAGPLLSFAGVRSIYGQIEALRDVGLVVQEVKIVTLIGANGVGKSTLLMTICGLPAVHAGQIIFHGRDITCKLTKKIVRLGISQSLEGRRVFLWVTVAENLLMGIMVTRGVGSAADMVRVLELFPYSGARQHQRAGTMSGGEQQMLAIGKAVMSRLRLLFLDEPSLGLAPLIVKAIFAVIGGINRTRETTVLLVEQNASRAPRVRALDGPDHLERFRTRVAGRQRCSSSLPGRRRVA